MKSQRFLTLFIWAFSGNYPSAYKDPSGNKDGDNPYADPDAAALASLLQKDAHVVCGTLTECTDVDVLLCYFKPIEDASNAIPVE